MTKMTRNSLQDIMPARCEITGSRLRMVLAGSGMALLAACSSAPIGPLDWDLRAGDSSTAADARQATAAKPQADANGVLSYPGYQLVQARRGDTLAAVASRLGLNPTELARANALQPGDQLREGELLLLPARVSAMPQPVASPTATPRPTDITAVATSALDKVETKPLAPAVAAAAPGGGKEPTRHLVKRGETAFIIARAYNVSAKALAEWNGLGADMAVREGQTLIIPVATGRAPDPVNTPSSPGNGSPTPIPPSASKPMPNEKTEVAAAKPKDTPASPDLGATRTAASAAKLAMPLSGNIIKGYDKKSNQGVNIAAAGGSAVKAAEAGTVAAITKDADQVQIVVIRHANNLLTVYAGVDALKVNKGDSVSRGQQIGALRGGSNPFLHFEVRKGVDSLDPMSYLQ